jgi:dsDNA-binding SOS-regulon protein
MNKDTWPKITKLPPDCNQRRNNIPKRTPANPVLPKNSKKLNQGKIKRHTLNLPMEVERNASPSDEEEEEFSNETTNSPPTRKRSRTGEQEKAVDSRPRHSECSKTPRFMIQSNTHIIDDDIAEILSPTEEMTEGGTDDRDSLIIRDAINFQKKTEQRDKIYNQIQNFALKIAQEKHQYTSNPTDEENQILYTAILKGIPKDLQWERIKAQIPSETRIDDSCFITEDTLVVAYETEEEADQAKIQLQKELPTAKVVPITSLFLPDCTAQPRYFCYMNSKHVSNDALKDAIPKNIIYRSMMNKNGSMTISFWKKEDRDTFLALKELLGTPIKQSYLDEEEKDKEENKLWFGYFPTNWNQSQVEKLLATRIPITPKKGSQKDKGKDKEKPKAATVEIVRDKKTNISFGYAFVKFPSEKMMSAFINVKFAVSRTKAAWLRTPITKPKRMAHDK